MKIIIFFLFIFIVILIPTHINAQFRGGRSGGTGGGASFQPTLPFGGLVSYTIPCTCPSSIGNLWIWFTPLYLGAPVPATGSLVYVPYSSRLFAWFNIGIPATWHLGSYHPGVQACWMIIPPPGVGCFPLPSAGVITQVGTSKPI